MLSRLARAIHRRASQLPGPRLSLTEALVELRARASLPGREASLLGQVLFALVGFASDGMLSPADLDSLGGETLLYLDTVLDALAQGSANAQEIREALEPVSSRR